MIVNENGKKQGWEGQGIQIFYENGVGTKISSRCGIQDFDVVRDAMYVLGITEYICTLEDGTIGIFKDYTYDKDRKTAIEQLFENNNAICTLYLER